MNNFLKQRDYFPILLLLFLLVWYTFFLLQKINLTTADLGRHLKNGELILQGKFDVLKTNFYSYTHPDFNFLNHHWISGVIFFCIWKIIGFVGLHIFSIFLGLITFLIFFRLAEKESNTPIAFVVSLLIIPLIAERKEIRPEIFSCFFSGLFFWLLWNYKQKNVSYKHLFLLPLIEIIWVNTHIYWILGLGLIAVFLLEQIILYFKKARGKKIKNLAIIFLLTIAATLFNPFGLKGTLHPLNVYKNYGYRILEEQSVIFLEKLGFIQNPNFFLFKIIFSLLALSFVWVLIKNRLKFSFANFLLACGFGLMAWTGIRNFTIFGLFTLPIMAANIKIIFSSKIRSGDILALGLFIFIITLFTHYQNLPVHNNEFGLGLLPKINQSADFFKEKNILGPIFNNYDIGGYLIYHMFPKERVFVDNRPETYPASFFQDVYIPLQQNEDFWHKKQEEYKFNAIFFYRHDSTPWAQPFLVERVKNADWAPVFVDDYTIIFVKRNDLNQDIIKKYEIPKEYFKITEN